MTVPLPSAGDTSWYDWAGDIHTRVAEAAKANYLDVRDFGAVCNGTTDDAAALNATLTAAAAVKGVAVIPSGLTVAVASQITVPVGASLLMDGAIIKATADIAGAMIVAGTLTAWWRNCFIRGGYLDCNGKADDALQILSGRNVDVDYVTWTNQKRHGLILGSPSATFGSHEIHVTKPFQDKTPDVAATVDAVGIWMTSKCFDTVISDGVVIGADISFLNEGAANTLIGCHGYGITASTTFPHTVFKDAGSDNQYLGCYPDTPRAYGFWFTSTSYRWSIIGGRVVNNPTIGLDDVVVGVHSDLGDPNTGTIIGLSQSGGASARIAQDYDQYIGSPNLRVLGCTASNVVIPNLRIDNLHSANIRRYRMTGNSPSVSAGAGAGTSPPTPTLASNSRDQGGVVRLGTGTSPAADVTLATVTFNTPFSITPFVTLTPQDTTTAKLQIYATNVTTTTFDIKAATAPAAGLAATALQVAYHVMTSA